MSPTILKGVSMAEKKAAKKTAAHPAAKMAAKKAAAHPGPRADKAGEDVVSDSRKGQGPASELITARIRELRDWRGEKLALVRMLIREADPTIVEEWKWETPVWSHDGIVCTGETYTQIVKLTFAKGAFLADPHHLFNAGLTGNVRRAIDLRAQDEVDGPSFRELIREAVAFNQGHPPKHRRPSARPDKRLQRTAPRSLGRR
jgi:hypothetical protein